MKTRVVKFLFMSIMFTSIFSSFLFGATERKSSGSKQQDSKRTSMEPKNVYVDLTRILTFDPNLLSSSSLEWRKHYTKLQSMLEPIEGELKTLEEKFAKVKSEFESLQKSSVASNEALQSKYQEAAKAQVELEQRMREREQFAQDELKKIQFQLSPKIEKAIKEVRKAGGYQLVLRKEFVLDAEEGLDVTNDVLSIMNKEYQEEESKTKAKDQQK